MFRGARQTHDIFAAGDCALTPQALWTGGPIRLESVQNAIDQAKTVAAAIMGQDAAPYDAVPWFWSDQGNAKLQTTGLPVNAPMPMCCAATQARAASRCST
jgi:3-phenylpropionate/trans-cinnamate dioxygenase ferredoxin reductase component